MKEKEIAISAAHAAGAIIKNYYESGVEIREKGSYNLVSNADLEAEEAIASTIKSAFPNHAIFAEETHKDSIDSEHVWIVDPLDGTNNFAHGIPQFACSIAYIYKGEAQVGIVHNPVRNDSFIAIRGEGAYYNNKLVEVSSAKKLSSAMIGTGFYYDRGAMMEATLAAINTLFKKQIHGIRRFGSAAIDLCYVGTGYFDAFFEYTLEPWDYAAGKLFVEEAGGMVSTHCGEDLGHTRSSLLASNKLLHDEMVEVLNHFQP